MKKLLFALLAVAVSPPIFAQESGTITSTQCVAIDVKVDKSTVGIQVTGTWSGTLQPQVSIQGQPAANTQVVPSTSTTPQATITGNGVFYANVGGGGIFQVCGNTVSSGTANIFLNGSKGVNASTLGGGGSGSGTVSANNTAAGAVANYAAAAGSTTVGPTTLNYVAPTVTVSTAGGGNGSIALSGNTSGTATLTAPAVAGTVANAATLSNSLTVNGPQVTVSVAGNGNGVLSLAGNTSGNATITAPAVAGTSTNPVTISNIFAGPDGTAAAATYGFTSCASCGVRVSSGFTVLNGSTAAALQTAGTTIMQAEATGLFTASKLLIGTGAPTIAGAGCGGSAASIANNNGTAAFTINVGTAPTSGGCTVTLPTASTGWACFVTDITTNSTGVFLQKQISTTTTSVVLQNFSDVAVATAPTASDIWQASCHAF